MKRLHPKRNAMLRTFLMPLILASATVLSSPNRSRAAELTSIVLDNPQTGAVTNRGYFISRSANETRIYKEGHHFLSVLSENGIFALRPHPGKDVDGWGSTLYLQPFIAGTTVLGHTSVPNITVVTNNGVPSVRIEAAGLVSRGLVDSYGTWQASLNVVYDNSNKKINATGSYNVNTPGTLEGIGDINFYKLASNFLRDVPVLDGTTTNTGDMAYFEFNGDVLPGGFSKTNKWDFAKAGSSYPQDYNTKLLVNLIGDENVVDTVRQGYEAINPACKPNLKVLLEAANPDSRVMMGIGYSVPESKDFAADNVGLTGYVTQKILTTNFSFNVDIESSAIPKDKYSSEVTLTGTGTNTSYQSVYFSPSASESFTRVGSMKRKGATFTGKYKVDSSSAQGFFRSSE